MRKVNFFFIAKNNAKNTNKLYNVDIHYQLNEGGFQNQKVTFTIHTFIIR